jgi:hypothetical protein
MNTSLLAGTWTYRSFLNSADLVGDDATKSLALIFGEGTLTVTVGTDTLFQSVLDFGGGAAMDLYGEIIQGSGVNPDVLIITGAGREGTSTAKWVYQYKGYFLPTWSEGVNQVPAIVGTVIRTISHGKGNAGVVASFVIVKR